VQRVTVFGQTVDPESRCVHWHGPSDVVAMKFVCCDRFYPCFDCHLADADHPAERWPVARFAEPAVLCGVCAAQLSVDVYLSATACPSCAAEFNPGCALHAHLYFEVAPIGAPHA
jgi:uncharacterized CHY-type Zn-finger protein